MTQMYLCAGCGDKSRDLESMSATINKSHQHDVCCSVVWVLESMATSSFFTTRWFGRVLSPIDTLPNSLNHWENVETQWKKSLRRHCVSNEHPHDTSSFHFSNHEPVWIYVSNMNNTPRMCDSLFWSIWDKPLLRKEDITWKHSVLQKRTWNIFTEITSFLIYGKSWNVPFF